MPASAHILSGAHRAPRALFFRSYPEAGGKNGYVKRHMTDEIISSARLRIPDPRYAVTKPVAASDLDTTPGPAVRNRVPAYCVRVAYGLRTAYRVLGFRLWVWGSFYMPISSLSYAAATQPVFARACVPRAYCVRVADCVRGA